MRSVAIVMTLTMMAACGGCGGESESMPADDGVPAAGEAVPAPSPTTPTPADAEPATEGGFAEAAAGEDQDPVDLLTYGAGAFPIRIGADAEAAARVALDGIPNYATIDRIEPRTDFVIELPAETTFETFGIPMQSSSGCCYGKHVKTVIIEGSGRSPDESFREIVRFDVDRDESGPQHFDAAARLPVRWVRVTLEGRQTPYESDHDPTGFTELLGYGTQAAIDVAPDAFTGLWLTGGGGSGPDGNRIELIQDGALITGCGIAGGAQYSVSGGIENGLAKLRFRGDTLTTVAVVNSENQLSGALIGRAFTRLIGEPGGSPTPCSPGREPPPNPVAEALDAGEPAVVYGINFDVDSDRVRADAEPALRQILAALGAGETRAVTIEGHTDSDASDAHNLDLSQRRAQAVVDWLVGRGIQAERLTPVGKGEGEPIADNGTSAGKAANRRVEVEASS
jgi:OmpA-OmpF porin, OOP family